MKNKIKKWSYEDYMDREITADAIETISKWYRNLDLIDTLRKIKNIKQ